MGSDDRVAIITGAAKGIGKEIALTLADCGIKIVIADIDLEEAKKVKEEIILKDGKALAVKVDVSKKEDVDLMMEKTIDEFNGIDILVNNAGICYRTPFEELTENEWDKVMDVNLKGAYLCSQAVLPEMKKNSKGKIINMASLAGKIGGILV